MILQDDSPAVQELQDEEMEVEVEVEGETARSASRTGNSMFTVETDLLKPSEAKTQELLM